jgi:ABC-type transport system substrate-binding protein
MMNPTRVQRFRATDQDFPHMTAPHHPHQAPRRLAVLVAFLAAAGAVVSAPPADQEDPKGGVKKKVVVEGDVDYQPKVRLVTAPDVRLDELALAAFQTTNKDLKALYTRFAVPHDQLTEKSGATPRIRPFSLLWGKDTFPKDKAFNVTELDASGRPTETRPAIIAEIRQLDSYEQLVAAAVDQLLKQKPAGVTIEEQLTAADKLVAAALRFHDYARAKNIRQGKSWESVRPPLVDTQKTVWLQQMKAAVTATDWPKVGEVSGKLLTNYSGDPAVAREVSTARVGAVKQLMQAKTHANMVRAREMLDELEAKLPGGGGEAAKKARQELSEEAVRLFNRAKELLASGDKAGARDAMRNAEALDPTVPGLRDLQRELRAGYPILVVGVRQFPERMSPATARLDSEKQAVALMFEGLLEEVPDDSGGVRYRPGAARYLPLISPGGRELALRVAEGAGKTAALDAHDVVGTVKLMRTRPELWVSAGLPWFPDNDLPTPTATGGVRLPFKVTHPDPRALLTFKVLPGRWLSETGKSIDDPEFATRPSGTGPYRLHAVPSPNAKGPREMVFVDNTTYGKWPDRTGLPYIREIRFVETARLPDLVSEFKYDRIHILTDVPTTELDKFTGQGSGLGGKVVVATAQNNRRVHILAVNHRRPHLQNKELRRGLAAAVERETILSNVFRGGKNDYHREMTGPFPPTSWATIKGPNGKGPKLSNQFLAANKLKAYLAAPGAKPDISLAYPDDDPQAKAACEAIKAQVEVLFKGVNDPKARLTITLDPVPPRELVRRVEEEHRYDLAYVPFDYPDDWHPFGLAAFLDPTAAERDGRNWLGYLTPATNPDADDLRLGRLLAELRSYRDYSGALVPKVRGPQGIDELFNDCMPFIPLWQLDRHTLVHTSLKIFVDDSADPANPRVLNPTVLFHNVARWRLD